MGDKGRCSSGNGSEVEVEVEEVEEMRKMVEDKGRCSRGNGSEVEGHDKSIQLAPAVHNILGDGGIIQDI